MISNIKTMVQDRSFLQKTFRIALPVAMQGMLNTVVNLVDTLMIGTLGETAIAAVGLANKVFFVYSLLVFGVCSGGGVLASQYWGSGDRKNIHKVMGLSLIIALGGSLCFAFPAITRPALVMRIFTISPETIRVGASYLTIAAICYPFIAFTNVYVAMLRSVGQVKLPVATSCMAIVINIVLNFLLIFPAREVTVGFLPCGTLKSWGMGLGVVGAAIATLTARIAESVVLLVIVTLKRYPIVCRIPDLFGYSRAFLRQFFTTCLPVIINEFTWGLGTTMYSLVYGRMGDNAVAAITIATTVQDIMFVLFQGLGAATAVILGHEMGAGNLKRAEQCATNFIVLSFLSSLCTMGVCFAIHKPILSLYRVSPEVLQSTTLCLMMFILYIPAKNFNFINIVGILRSGGDTKMCLFLDSTGVWLIGIPLAFLGGLVLKLPIHIVYAMVMSEEIYKMALGYPRYRKKKWLRNLAAEL